MIGREPPRATKAWLHPATGEAMEFDIDERHEDVLRADPARYGLAPEQTGGGTEDRMMAAAVDAGWVRIADSSDAMLVTAVGDDEDRGYVTAADLASARQDLRWLERAGLLPSAVDVEVGYGTDRVIALRGDALVAFLRRGVLRGQGATAPEGTGMTDEPLVGDARRERGHTVSPSTRTTGRGRPCEARASTRR